MSKYSFNHLAMVIYLVSTRLGTTGQENISHI